MSVAVDLIMVGAIVAAAIFFTLRKLARDVSGKSACGCSGGCAGGCDSDGSALCKGKRHLQ